MQVGPILFGQAADAVSDTELLLAYDYHAAVAQKFVVVEQAACDCILDGYECHHVAVCGNRVKYVIKSLATDQF